MYTLVHIQHCISNFTNFLPGILQECACSYMITTFLGPCKKCDTFMTSEIRFLDKHVWEETLLPKLASFHDNCVVPEIVSPIHSLGLPIRNVAKEVINVSHFLHGPRNVVINYKNEH